LVYVHKHKPEVDVFMLDDVIVAISGGAAVGITGVVTYDDGAKLDDMIVAVTGGVSV